MSDDMNIVMAVSMGGDDFIPKPFTLEVLAAKIQALLRRNYDFAGSASVCEHNVAILNLADATLLYEDQKVELTKNELRILQTLFENNEKVVSRDTLMMKLWENDEYVDENTLSVNVNRLRKKLAKLRHLREYADRLKNEGITLPERGDAMEQIYREMIEELNTKRKLSESAYAKSQSEMREYYAMWVHQIKTPIAAMQLLVQVQQNDAGCLLATFVVFAIIYYVVFKVTSRSYYKIVGNQI